jgi:hypothetical protein
MVVMILASPHYGRAPSAGGARGFQPEPMMQLSAGSSQWRPVTGRDWRQTQLRG